MARVKGGVTAHARHKKILKKAAGYYGRRKNTFRAANAAVERAGKFAYVGRKQKKRNSSGNRRSTRSFLPSEQKF